MAIGWMREAAANNMNEFDPETIWKCTMCEKEWKEADIEEFDKCPDCDGILYEVVKKGKKKNGDRRETTH